MADGVEIISAEIRLKLDEMENDALAAQKRMRHFAQEFAKLGEEGGKIYVQGFNKGSANYNKRLNDFVGAMSGISPKMGALGDKMAGAFSKPIFTMVPAVSAAFQAMLPVIGTIIAAVAAVAAAVSKAAKAQKEFTNNVKLAGQAADILKGKAEGLSAAQAKQNELSDRQAVAAAKVQLALQKIGDVIKNAVSPVLEFFNGLWTGLLENLGNIAGGLGVFLSALGLLNPGFLAAGTALIAFGDSINAVSDEEARAAANAQLLKEQNAELIAETEKYEKELKNIAYAETVGAWTARQSLQSQIDASENYLDTLIKIRNEVEATAKARGADASNELANYDQSIRRQLANQNNLQANLKLMDEEALKTKQNVDFQAELNRLRDEAEKAYKDAVGTAQAQKRAGLIEEKQLQEEIDRAKIQRYLTLDGIVRKNDIRRRADGKNATIDLRDKYEAEVKANAALSAELKKQQQLEEERKNIEAYMANLINEQADTLKQQAIARAKEADETDLAVQLENDLMLTQRARYRAAIQLDEEWAKLGKETRDQILEDFDKITEGYIKTVKTVKKNPVIEFFDKLFDSDEYKASVQLANAAVGAFQSIASSISEIMRIEAQKSMDEIDRILEEKNKKIEDDRTAALEAAGFIEAASSESMQAQIDAAIEANDEILQYQLERRREEMRINEEYDELARQADEKAKQEKAEIEHEAALKSWEMQIALAVAQIPLTILDAIASGWATPAPVGGPWLAAAYAGLAAAAAGVQLKALEAAKPVKFETGGIVPGNSYSGDRIAGLLNSREMVLTLDDQKELLGLIRTPGQQSEEARTLTVQTVLDGRVIAESTVDDYINKGIVLIDARRGIRGLR